MTDDTRAPEAPAAAPLSRRTLVKAAAWSAPVIAMAAVAPSAAASTRVVNAIRGRLKVYYLTGGGSTTVDLIGDDPQHPAYGIDEITGTVSGQVITNAKITVWINKDIPNNAWTPRNNVGDTQWNRPVKVGGPDGSGFYQYELTYKTASTTVTVPGTTSLNAGFHFRASISGNSVTAKAAWSAAITPSTTPALNEVSQNTVTLNSNGTWQYLRSTGVPNP